MLSLCFHNNDRIVNIINFISVHNYVAFVRNQVRCAKPLNLSILVIQSVLETPVLLFIVISDWLLLCYTHNLYHSNSSLCTMQKYSNLLFLRIRS